jgi:hypothetical protein
MRRRRLRRITERLASTADPASYSESIPAEAGQWRGSVPFDRIGRDPRRPGERSQAGP